MKGRIRKLVLPSFLTVLLLVVLSFEIYLLRLSPEQIPTRFVVVSLFVVNVLALVTLVFFVVRSLFRLYLERHREVPGHRFKTKIVSIFVGLVMIPSALLFIAFSGVLESSIEKIFSKANRKALSQAVDTVKAFYDFEKQRLLSQLEDLAAGRTEKPLSGIEIRYLKIPEDNMPLVFKEAFEGKSSVQILSGKEGDLIVAAIPYRGGILTGVSKIPPEITKQVEQLLQYHEEYLQVGSIRRAVKANYFMFLGFLSLIIVFLALWTSMKISQEITAPIGELVEATNQVSRGNLKVKVKAKSSDELGILINSFNDMIEKLDRAYSEVSERNLLLEMILSNINSGVIFLSTEGVILTINKAGEAILGIDRESIVGKHYSKIVERLESDDLKRFISRLSSERITENSQDFDIKVNHRAMKIRARIIPLRDSNSESRTGFLVVFDDITDIVRAQQAVAWEEVARRLAHEIKNPLTPIKLATERLIRKWRNRDRDFEQVFEKSTKTIISEVDSLKNLIDSFQKFGKLPEIKRENCNIETLINEVIELYSAYRDVKFSSNFEGQAKEVSIDREEFKRVLINIIDNAVKAMEGRGEIEISVKIDSKLTVEVADTGPGIEDDLKEILFLPYFSKSKDGTGLGLAIAKKIIEGHGGYISVHKNSPKGTVFRIEVPL